MKFLCDRCKTRYSIADERVRGKILKIRCKNCSNVITVREGMPEPEPQQADPRRTTRPTDHAPSVMGAAPSKPAPPSPLQNAFAQAMQKPAAPPPALEEEWYVSIDGNQEGPFSLGEAQEWVKSKRADDDLHCWCEGFDDWLPVEKVSHFRGMRARKAPPKPPVARAPELPRSAKARTGETPQIPAKPLKPEDEPKPLFAAALAALEAGVPKPDAGNGAGAPAAAAPRARRQTAGEAAIAEMRQNVPVPAKPALSTTTGRAALPLPHRDDHPLAGRLAKAPLEPAPQLARATPLTGTPARADKASRPLPADTFADVGGDVARPVNGVDTDFPDADGDDDLAIGEVSRVVRLQDLAASGGRRTAAKPAVTPARASATVQALGDAAPASSLAEAAHASLTDEHGMPAAAADAAGESAPLVAVTAPPRRPNHLILMAAAGAALVFVIGLVVFLAASSDDDDGSAGIGGAGGDVEGLAISVDDPRYPRLGKQGETATGNTKQNRPRRTTGGGGGGGNQVATGGGATVPGGKTEIVMGPNGPVEPLTPDDVITQALRMSTGTQRCYSRALKDDPFIKVKSIAALLQISADGKVTDVSLDQMQGSPLGQCLVAAIKRWPFRQSTEGLNTKITLKFEQTMP